MSQQYVAVNLSKLLRSVFIIHRINPTGTSNVIGSGFCFMENNLAVTSKHIMQHQALADPPYSLRLQSAWSAELIKPVNCIYHNEQDIALLTLETPSPATPLLPCRGTQAGFYYAAYSPKFAGIKIHYIPRFYLPEAWEGKHSTINFFEWDGPIERGNSGGPLVGTDGGAAGILTEIGVTVGATDVDGNSENITQTRSRAVYIGPLQDLYARWKHNPQFLLPTTEPFR